MKKFKFSIDGNKFEVSVNELDNNTMDVVVNGSNYTVVVDKEGSKASNATVVSSIAKKTPGKVDPIPAPAPSAASNKVVTVKSQLPGSIIKVLVTEGQSVKKGEVIMTIESMKMENNIMAEADGVIGKIYVEAGKSVMQDDKLVDITVSGVSAPAPAPAPAAQPKPVSAPAAKPEAAPAPAASAANAKPVKSPLPGSIIKILVSEGESVKRGQTLLTMESMKMENEIKAEKDGVVTSIKVTPGQNVMQEDDLLMMA